MEPVELRNALILFSSYVLIIFASNYIPIFLLSAFPDLGIILSIIISSSITGSFCGLIARFTALEHINISLHFSQFSMINLTRFFKKDGVKYFLPFFVVILIFRNIEVSPEKFFYFDWYGSGLDLVIVVFLFFSFILGANIGYLLRQEKAKAFDEPTGEQDNSIGNQEKEEK